MNKKITVCLILLLAFMVLLRAYRHYYWEVFQRGFDRGALMEARYEQCFPGKGLSIAARKKLSHFVNDPFSWDCKLIDALAKTSEAEEAGAR